MNESITGRFSSYQRLLVESSIVSHFSVIRLRISSNAGHIRIRANLVDGGLLELSEYLAFSDGSLIDREYSFQWQDAQQQLVCRWDNAKHFLHLPFAPHHIHRLDGAVEGNASEPTLSVVLDTMEQDIGS